MSMNQKYHVVFKKGKVTIRRPWKRGEELFSSSGDPTRGVSAMFGEHEKRQFLEALGPFIVISVEDKQLDIARQLIYDGYTVVDPDTGEQSKWNLAGYYVRDEGPVYIMLPEVTTDDQFFSKLGLRIDVEKSWGNGIKVSKYLKRLYSHHRRFVQGTVIDSKDDVIHVRLDNDKTISVKYADHGKLTDGMNLVSGQFMRLLGLKQSAGAGLRTTALSPLGFSKGHSFVKPDLRYDMVMFNSKKLLFGDQFMFGMDWLHSGAVKMDSQSYTNFRMVQHHKFIEWCYQFDKAVGEAVKDEQKLRRMLQFYHADFHQTHDEDGDPVFIEKDVDWALLRAMRGGVKVNTIPALCRKVFHLFSDTVANIETNIRVPIPEDAGGASYALVDPSIFDVWGDPVLDGELKDNTVYCHDYEGDIVFHRQPNAHRGEHHIAKAVKSEYLKSMDTGCFMFISRDVIESSLAKLGGGDQDDRLVYYKDPIIVDHFRELESDPYPLVVEPEAKPTKTRINVFESLLVLQPAYNRTLLGYMLDQIKKQQLSIGYAVNAIMHDTVLTDNKQELISYLLKLPQTPKNALALEWMKGYKGNVLNKVASKLELVIDAIKKEGSDLKDIGNEIRNFNNEFQVVSLFMTRGGRFDGRVPASRRGETYPVIVECAIDRELAEVQLMRKDLEDIITDLSWQMVEPIADEIATMPTIPGSEHLALAMKAEYRNQWANLTKEIERTGDHREAKQTIDAFKKIDASMVSMFGNHPLILDAMVHLWITIYENRRPLAPRDENGRPQRFPDGMLWGPRMSLLTMRMLERVGLAGRFIPVDFEPEFKHLRGTEVDVRIEGSNTAVVTQEGTQEIIGTVDPMAVGATKVDHGLVFVPAKDALPYEPEKRYMTLDVVAGWTTRPYEPTELIAWRNKIHKEVVLIPYLYIDAPSGEAEHAVRVELDGVEYGHISKKDAPYVTKQTRGWLLLGGTKLTMKVLIEG